MPFDTPLDLITDITNLINDYLREKAPELKATLDAYSKLDNLEACIGNLSINILTLKKSDHQQLIKPNLLEDFSKVIFKEINLLKNSSDFDDIYITISKLASTISGIGELTVYDASLKIGSYLSLYPEKVFLHAGAKEGANYLRELGLLKRTVNTKNSNLKARMQFKSDFPEYFDMLTPWQLENFLCCKRDNLKNLVVKFKNHTQLTLLNKL